MGRREAWSADRTGNTRTKPTRWEFQQPLRGDNAEKLGAADSVDGDDTKTSHLDVEEEAAVAVTNRSNRPAKAK